MSIIREAAAHIMLISIYSFTYLAALLGGIVPRRPWKPNGRIMVTGTFHNPNWYLSHVTPLSRSGVKEVILVVDEPQLPLQRVRFVCPPRWVSRLLSRAGAKGIWMIVAGLRYRPDLYMGYSLVPGACLALVAGKLLGRPSCYQMTGGPIVIKGGGIDAIGRVGSSLGQASRFIETLALRVVREFELVVVRGNRAKEFLAAHGIEGSVAIITGSVNDCKQLPQNDRDIHMIYVGRLSPIKQVHQFIAVVDAIRRTMPNVRAAIVGDGPVATDLQNYTKKLALADNIKFLGKRKDVWAFLVRSRIFVLTSRSEGLSIAMAEAMSAGAVPVVADVGELGDLVTDGVNGYLIEPNNIGEYANRIMYLLQDQTVSDQYSRRAIEAAKEHCGIEVITGKWRRYLRNVVSQASGHCVQEVMD